MQASDYRTRFAASYPFLPEVIDVLYHRWGSFHLQRTRGVLRLLSLVIHSLKDSNISYISLADFDLGQQELRQELKHIGSEFNSVIASDISALKPARKKSTMPRRSLPGLADRRARSNVTIFLHSFSGGQEHGAIG